MLDRATTAVLAIDLQHDFLSPDGYLGSKHVGVGELERAIGNLLRGLRDPAGGGEDGVVGAATSEGVSGGDQGWPGVWWVTSAYDGPRGEHPPAVVAPAGSTQRVGMPLLRDLQLDGSLAGTATPCCVPGTRGAEMHPDLARLAADGDGQVTKRWFSAFAGTDLEAQLRQRGARTVVVAGVLSHTSVLATCADAAVHGFDVVVVRECLGWTSAKRHAEALDNISRWYGRVLSLTDAVGARTARTYGAGDSFVVEDALPADLAASAFDALKAEVDWQVMQHRGGAVPRLVAAQAQPRDDGSAPIYRHPADEHPRQMPFTPTVDRIRRAVEQRIGQELNHVLIQLYRDGKDYISEHSDKTLDVVHGTAIVNVSLGAERAMVLHSKRDVLASGALPGAGQSEQAPPRAVRKSQRFGLPHNSMFVMGQRTNREWLHGIAQDKMHQHTTVSPETNSFERISLTFRTIGTFCTADGQMIYGQGARGKTRETARPVSTDPQEAQELLNAYGRENQRSDFDWDEAYGRGFDVIDCMLAA
ncbi:hypothetical protein HK105_200266 [Polyrhizophydium stewartii]|uniref:Fe2OG dioxygenase domain-containing protein n=1 Tax=Polyrhizophydium stewartii TaxID=2732419 RepID=A0ABR4NKY9_9FUNG|nr:hypothetical protein HK105_005188 [Polyrhizophydium stewartii]